MAIWLYAASRSKASDVDTLSLACHSGFVWRPFYNRNGTAIACVRQIQPGDTLLLGYRDGRFVRLLGQFRVGRPDHPIDASSVFGAIPVNWRDEFQRHGYTLDPILNELVGIFVEESEPVSGQVPYGNQNALSRLGPEHSPSAASARPALTSRDTTHHRIGDLKHEVAFKRSADSPLSECSTRSRAVRDGVHIGIDVGGRCEKGFDLCITEWLGGTLHGVQWKRLPHTSPLPPTHSLRHLVRDGDMEGLASATRRPASITGERLWRELEKLSPVGIYIDSPSAFARNQLSHGRRCEKRSLTGVSFQSTPSVARASEHGGNWGWLVYGMIAFSACLHRGNLSEETWARDLAFGTCSSFDSADTILRECFPTATISVLRGRKRQPDIEQALSLVAALPEVEAVIAYLNDGVAAVKRPTQSVYDRADALVAALGALPHVSSSFREAAHCGQHGKNWLGTTLDERIEGTFVCVE